MRARRSDDRGSAVVAFVLVTPLLLLVCLGSIQVVVTAMVRTAITSAALEAARVGAQWGSDAEHARRHARDLLAERIDLEHLVSIEAGEVSVDAVDMMRVRIEVVGTALGPLPASSIVGTAHVVREQP